MRKRLLFGTGRVALLAGDEEHADAEALSTQRFGGGYLRGQDSLGIRDAAAIDKLRILAEWNVRRNGVHVRGKDQVRRLAGGSGVDVPARAGRGAFRWLRHRRLFDAPAPAGKKSGQEVAHRALVVGSGLNFAELAGKPDGINGVKRLTFVHDAARISHRMPRDCPRVVSNLDFHRL